jgi:hypothetical protein
MLLLCRALVAKKRLVNEGNVNTARFEFLKQFYFPCFASMPLDIDYSIEI